MREITMGKKNKVTSSPSTEVNVEKLTGKELAEESIIAARIGGEIEAKSFTNIVDFLATTYRNSILIDNDSDALHCLKTLAKKSNSDISIRASDTSVSILLKFAMGMGERKSRRSTYSNVLSNAAARNVDPKSFKVWLKKHRWY